MPAVLREKRDRIAFITLNRPQVLNAFDREMHRQLREAWRDFRQDDDVWVAVVAPSVIFSSLPLGKSVSIERTGESSYTPNRWQELLGGPWL